MRKWKINYFKIKIVLFIISFRWNYAINFVIDNSKSKKWGLMLWLLSGPPGFTCCKSFAPVLRLCTVESVSLLSIHYIS